MRHSIDTAASLGDLVTMHPQLAREFEALGLDYCCGGTSTLWDACTARGLDPSSTAAELSDAVTELGEAEWATMRLAELVDHIEGTHHRYLDAELPRLSVLMAKIVAVHGERHPELGRIAACYEAVRADLEPHLRKEEQVLFPMIRELARAEHSPAFHCGTLRNPISVMLGEHDAVGDQLALLRRLTNDFTTPADGCASYAACFAGLAELEADTHLHIHKENNVLFPLVVRREAELVAKH